MKKLIIFTMVFTFLATPAMADPYGTVDVKFKNVAPGLTVGLWSSNINYPGGTSFWTGVYNITLSNVAGVPVTWEPYLTGTVESFCVDIWDRAPGSAVQYDILPLAEVPDAQSAPYGGMGALRAGYAAELLDRYWNDAYLKTAVAATNNLRAASLQAALWEIVDEQSQVQGDPNPAVWNLSFGSGNFYVGNINVANLGNAMLNAIRADGQASFIGDYAGLSNPSNSLGGDPKLNYQDYVVKVPAPAAVLLGMLGLSVAGLKLRKFA